MIPMSTASMPALLRPERSHFRWTVCALLFFATIMSYVDRQVLSMLAKTLETSIGWNAVQYGNITMAFSIAYGLGVSGRAWGHAVAFPQARSSNTGLIPALPRLQEVEDRAAGGFRLVGRENVVRAGDGVRSLQRLAGGRGVTYN